MSLVSISDGSSWLWDCLSGEPFFQVSWSILPQSFDTNFVFTVAFTVIWLKQTKIGAISGAIVGLIAGLIAWLVEAEIYYGELTIASTGGNYPTLAGNLAAIMAGLIVTVSVSLVFPDKSAIDNWSTTRDINAENRNIADEKHNSSLPTVTAEDQELGEMARIEEEPRKLKGALKLAIVASFAISFVMDFLVPMPMFFSHYIFSSGFFTGWVVIVSHFRPLTLFLCLDLVQTINDIFKQTFIWVFASSSISILLPIIEVRDFLAELAREIVADMRGKRSSKGPDVGYSGEQTRVPSIQGVDISVPGGKAEGVTSGKEIMAKEDKQRAVGAMR